MIAVLAFALLQQPLVYSSPLDGDTTGYWQQRASYDIVATLDEARGVLRATGTLTYVNHSPDTLHELQLHQHLNAFRPGSAWSAVDEREGRERFQRLPDPHHAFERFTAPPVIDGTPVAAEYPGAPDSTVVRLALPRALAPGDTVRVAMAWEARPSTLPRRQGRRGRSFDFAHWYPRVAVYDRTGWTGYALRPAGEFYGEFGDFDVTLVLPDDQVLGATGVVVEGDPGWERALRWGEVPRQPAAYDALPPAPAADVPVGHRRVRLVARDVHHFGWSVSPDYRYEGAWYLRADSARAARGRVWDSVAVHVLYRPGDEATWGTGQVVARTNVTLRWLEELFGPYLHPQMTVLHRIEGGGTEFPMLQMNGSPSQGLNLHEGGHVWAHGMLANNEWRAGWLDEGLSSYQTSWAQALTPQDRPRLAAAPPPVRRDSGYGALAVRPRPDHLALVSQARAVLLGAAQPIALEAREFRDFPTYSAMTYGRAEHMFGALRDAIGDDAMRRALRTYHDRWALRHVDELALRTAVRDGAGQELDWFFDQWLHRTGVVDYAMEDVDVQPDGDGWRTTARIVRHGDYRHPMPLGVRVDTGWVLARADAGPRVQLLTVHTDVRPLEVRLDPLRTTPDWFVPNNLGVGRFSPTHPAASRVVLAWPFLEQALGDRYVTTVAPLAWYGRPGGATGAVRLRTSYLSHFDRHEVGLAFASRLRHAATPPDPTGAALRAPRDRSRLQGWLTLENPMAGGGRPAMGLTAGVWHLDGVTRLELGQRWTRVPSLAAPAQSAHALTLVGTYPYERGALDGRRWSGRSVTDVTWRYTRRAPGARSTSVDVALTGGVVAGGGAGAGDAAPPDLFGPPPGDLRTFARVDASWAVARQAPGSRLAHRLRLFGGLSADAPLERGLYLAAASPTATFANHLWRPDGGLLSADGVPYRPLGGGGLRGYDPLVPATALVALNAEEAVRVARFGPAARPLDLELALFGDVGARRAPRAGEPSRTGAGGDVTRLVADAGLGLSLRGQLFDRPLRLRVDVPAWVHDPALALGARGRDATGDERVRLRWGFSFEDLW